MENESYKSPLQVTPDIAAYYVRTGYSSLHLTQKRI